ncbi:MAG: S8 family serine peptidase [Deltaproteobacteria bacterium]|nr:S8 family serine peptidase [Deltaproteobacteria bacterium]
MRLLRLVFMAGLVLVLATGTADWARAGFKGQDKILDPGLVDQTAKGGQLARVIVLLRGYEDLKEVDFKGSQSLFEQHQLAAAQVQDKVLANLAPAQGRVSRRFDFLRALALEVDRAGLESLAAMDQVAAIEEDFEQELMTAQGIALMNPGQFRSADGGTGVAVAVVDSGVNYRHPGLGGGGFPNAKVIGGFDLGNQDQDPMDVNLHGTACAGIVAGIDTGQGTYIGGVAPQAKLYALKVCTDAGKILTSALVAAWEWVLKHQNDDPSHPIMIISQSIGTKIHFQSHCDQVHNKFRAAAILAQSLVNNGIAIFVASGNERQTNGISYASCLKDTISVGAVYDEDMKPAHCDQGGRTRDRVTCYSNSARILDLLAPSECAYTPSLKTPYVRCFNGTSAACPYAAGAAAVIQSHFKKTRGRFLTVAQLKRRLILSGDPVVDPKSGVTTPRINLARAISQAGRVGEDGPGGDQSPVDKLREIIRDSKKQ